MNIEFNGAELRLARIFKGLALEEVADRVEKTRQYLHRLETGQTTPTEQLLRQLALVLKVEPSFLTNGHALMIREDQFHFRKLFTTRAMIKQMAMAHGELIGRLVTYLDREFGVIYKSKQSYYELFERAKISWKKTQKTNPKSEVELVKKDGRN